MPESVDAISSSLGRFGGFFFAVFFRRLRRGAAGGFFFARGRGFLPIRRACFRPRRRSRQCLFERHFLDRLLFGSDAFVTPSATYGPYRPSSRFTSCFVTGEVPSTFSGSFGRRSHAAASSAGQ